MTGPFHAVAMKRNGKLLRYDVFVNNRSFIRSSNSIPLRRHEAYAIARLLNNEKRSLKWADKFSDPYKRR